VVIRLRAWADDRARTYWLRSVCSACGSHNPAQNMDFTDRSTRGWAGSLCCLICPTAMLSIALLFCLTPLLRIGQKPRSSLEMHCKAPPGYSWPSAHPRASPELTLTRGRLDLSATARFLSPVYARLSLQRLPVNAVQSSCREGSMARVINHSGCRSSAPEGLTFSFPAFNKSQAPMVWRLVCAL
jgi:hypothetical protein